MGAKTPAEEAWALIWQIVLLVAAGLLLKEDVDSCVDIAAARWTAFAE